MLENFMKILSRDETKYKGLTGYASNIIIVKSLQFCFDQ